MYIIDQTNHDFDTNMQGKYLGVQSLEWNWQMDRYSDPLQALIWPKLSSGMQIPLHTHVWAD